MSVMDKQEGKPMGYLDIIRQVEAERKRQENEQDPAQKVVPVWQITWLGRDGKLQGPAQVNAIQPDGDGTVRAFVTLSDGWAAVSTKYATVVHAGTK